MWLEQLHAPAAEAAQAGALADCANPLQPELYHSFSKEADYLDSHFALLGSSSHVLGRPADGLQWHVYVAGAALGGRPTCSLEVCMTELDAAKAQQFFRSALPLLDHCCNTPFGSSYPGHAPRCPAAG